MWDMSAKVFPSLPFPFLLVLSLPFPFLLNPSLSLVNSWQEEGDVGKQDKLVGIRDTTGSGGVSTKLAAMTAGAESGSQTEAV